MVNALVERTLSEEQDVSQQVQARLKRADDLEKSVEELAGQISDLHSKITDKDRELGALRPLADKQDELNAREQALNAREKELDLRAELNEVKLKAQADRVDDHKAMVSLIFRNTAIRRESMVPVAVQSPGTTMCDGIGGTVPVDGGAFVEQHASTETEIHE